MPNIKVKIEEGAKEYATSKHGDPARFSSHQSKKDYINSYKGVQNGANLLLPDYERMREVLRAINKLHVPEPVRCQLETIKDLL